MSRVLKRVFESEKNSLGYRNYNCHDYYVYEEAYPESMGGAVFYIGKGRGDRINEHEREARRGHQCKKCDIIRSIWEADKQVAKRKIGIDLSEIEALQLEKETINQYDTEMLANSHMKNTYKAVTSEWHDKRSQAAKEKWEQIKASAWWQKKHA